MNLIRFCSCEMGTFGHLYRDGEIIAYTVEQPWRNNEPFKSCIPFGTYLCKLANHPKHGLKYELQDVPGRTAILIHVANTMDDVEGCIGLGDELGMVNNKWAVMNSGNTLQKFMMETMPADFSLTISGADLG